MINQEAFSKELVAAGISAKAAEAIAKNIINGAEYHVSRADFTDFKTDTRENIKEINAKIEPINNKLDTLRAEVFALKEYVAAAKAETKEDIHALDTKISELRADMREAKATRESQFRMMTAMFAGVIVTVIASAIIG